MGEVRFDIDKPDEFAWTRGSRRTQFDLTGWIVKKGIAKDTRQAEYILLGVMVFCLVAAFFFFHTSVGGTRSVPIPPEMLHSQ